MSAKKVLVVEDEGIVALSIRETLKKLGYEVVGIASSGIEAIRKAGEQLPDVILMDIRIKGDMDGIETAERITNLYEIPVIYLTAYTDDETLNRAMKSHPHSYLVKPFNERELYSNIEFAIYKHRIRQKTDLDSRALEHALSKTEDAAIVIDLKRQVVYCNPAAEQLCGRKKEDLVKQNLFHELDLHSVRYQSSFDPLTVKNVLERGSINYLHDTASLELPGGGTRQVILTAALLSDEEGSIRRILVFLREYHPDFAAPARTPRDLDEYQMMLDLVPEPMAMLDSNGKPLQWNSAFLRILHSLDIPKTVLQTSLSEAPAGSVFGSVQELRKVIESGKPADVVKTLQTGSGSQVYEFRFTPIDSSRCILTLRNTTPYQKEQLTLQALMTTLKDAENRTQELRGALARILSSPGMQSGQGTENAANLSSLVLSIQSDILANRAAAEDLARFLKAREI